MKTAFFQQTGTAVERKVRPTPWCCLAFLALVALAGRPEAEAATIDFQDLSLPANSYYNGSDGAAGFSSGGAHFNNRYETESWGGWSYSNVVDTDTRGWGNQYAAVAGPGLGTSGIYAVAYVDDYTPTLPVILLPAGTRPLSLRITNTTYTYYSMLEGDDFTKRFGGDDGNDPDFFRLTVKGFDAGGAITGETEAFLADFRPADNAEDFIVSEWTSVDLSSFATETVGLRFLLDSSDESIWGMNTPAYFALGEVTVIPEPRAGAAVAGLVALALGLLLRRRRPDRRL